MFVFIFLFSLLFCFCFVSANIMDAGSMKAESRCPLQEQFLQRKNSKENVKEVFFILSEIYIFILTNVKYCYFFFCNLIMLLIQYLPV